MGTRKYFQHFLQPSKWPTVHVIYLCIFVIIQHYYHNLLEHSIRRSHESTKPMHWERATPLISEASVYLHIDRQTEHVDLSAVSAPIPVSTAAQQPACAFIEILPINFQEPRLALRWWNMCEEEQKQFLSLSKQTPLQFILFWLAGAGRGMGRVAGNFLPGCGFLHFNQTEKTQSGRGRRDVYSKHTVYNSVHIQAAIKGINDLISNVYTYTHTYVVYNMRMLI